MADSILRLKVESQEYDQKIKRAAEGLRRYVDVCHQQGDVIGRLLGDTRKYVESIGQMDTVATNAKGQMRELSDALATLTQVYRGLSNEEKNAPFGQELSKQIGILTERAGQVKDAMGDVEQSILNAASDTRLFDQMAQGASVMTSTFQGLTGAGKLLGIEMGNDVEVIAKLQAAMAVTNSLSTIQNALQKQSALMQGVNAAKTALATAAQRALAAATGDATKAQAAYNLVANTNPYVLLATAIAAVTGAFYALGSSADDTSDKVNQTTNAINDMTEAANRYLEVAKQLGNADSYLDEMRVNNAKRILDYSRQTRVELQKQIADELRSGNFGSVNGLNKQLEDAKKAEKQAEEAYGRALDARRDAANVRLEFMSNWDKLGSEKQINAAIGFFTKLREEAEMGSAAWSMWQGRIESLQKRLPKSSTTSGKTTGGGRGGNTVKAEEILIEGSFADLTKQIQALQKEQAKATNAEEWNAWADAIKLVKRQIKELRGELVSISADPMAAWANGKGKVSVVDGILASTDKTNEKIRNRLQNTKLPTLKIEMPKQEDSWKKTEKAIGEMTNGLSEVANGLQQLGIKLPDGVSKIVNVVNGITSVINGTKTIMSALGSSFLNANTAALAANTTALIINAGTETNAAITNTASAVATAATLRIASMGLLSRGGFVPGAALGRIIPGNSFSGDNIFAGNAWVNSGELVLTKAQQGVLANALQKTEDIGQTVGTPYVSGEMIFLGLNNYLRRTGRGEIITSK